MAGKKIGSTKAIRIYGPYVDKNDPSKWAVHLYPAGSDKAIIVPTVGFNLEPLQQELGRELFKRLVAEPAGEAADVGEDGESA